VFIIPYIIYVQIYVVKYIKEENIHIDIQKEAASRLRQPLYR